MVPSALALSLTRAAALTGASSQHRPLFAALYLGPRSVPGDDWLTTCYRVAAVEPTSARGALLGLGACSEAEAYGVLRALLRRLAALGVSARAGIGPSLVLAQLAALRAPTHDPLVLVTPAAAPAFLHAVPVALLTHLHPQGALARETVERLQRYGLRTLGHIARMSELALRRQFGPTGALLAAIAHGRDIRPLCPVPEPAREHVRLRLAYPLAPERALALLPRLADQAAAHLHERRRATRELRLRVRWERGGVSLARRTLRAHTDDSSRLADEARHLLTTLLVERVPAASVATIATCRTPDMRPPLSAAAGRGRGRGTQTHHLLTTLLAEYVPVSSTSATAAVSACDAIAELRLTLSDFVPLVPTQATFWRIRAQRLAAAHTAADTLARRHGRPLLLHPRLAVPDAIFTEDRYRLAPPDDSEPVHSSSTPARAHAHRSPASPSDAWRDIPLARHWW